MLINGKEANLNAPAFGPGAELAAGVVPTVVQEPAPVVAPVEAPVVEVKKEEVIVPSEEENKVPYSRFKKFHDLAETATQEALIWKAKAEALSSVRQEKESVVEEMPDSWVKLYGETDESKEAWKEQQKLNDQIKKEARDEALRAVREERETESNRQRENVAKIENEFKTLSEYVGRPLTEKEQSAILDIVDEFTPKGEDGSYLSATISFDKAWEIQQLKERAEKAPKTEKRNAVATLTGSQTQGEPSSRVEADKNFNPSWGSLSEVIRKKLGS